MTHACSLQRLSLLLLSGLLLWTAPVFGQAACTRYASPTGGGNGLSQGSPYTIHDFIFGSPAPGDVLCLLDGTYTSGGIELGATPSGAAGSPLTFRALNDGGAFIDGQQTSRPLFLNGTSYITIQGIDFGNADSRNPGGSAADLGNGTPHHIIIQRSCFFNAGRPGPNLGQANNQHVLIFGAHDTLIEDSCFFGFGRNVIIHGGGTTTNNVFRRLWLRWDGWADNNGAHCPGATIQSQYGSHSANDRWENLITIFNGSLYDDTYHPFETPCDGLGGGNGNRDGIWDYAQGMHWNGMINYGYLDFNHILSHNPDPARANNPVGFFNRWVPQYFQDLFLDGRYAPGVNNHNIQFYCDRQNADESYEGGHCELFHGDRITSILNTGQVVSDMPTQATNFNECTSTGSCPNVYTGTGPGTGARACFEYQNDMLTSTPLWPWRMDDRIKQALARSGIAPTLQGSAGAGYGANTVTSEIVSRYGAIPAACLRGGGSGPPPPVACPTGGGMCAWWKFDEGVSTVAADATANGHTLNLTAGPTWQPGKIGSFGLHCDGTGGYAEQATAFGDALYTWTGWVKGDTDPSTTVTTAVVVNGNDTLPWGFAWGQTDANFRQAWFQRDAGGAYHAAKLTTPLQANTWYHIAGTYDGTNIKAYLNGQLQATTATGSAIAPTGTFTFCGIRATSSWAGTVDESRVWARALSATEVATEYTRAQKRVGHKRPLQ